MNNPDEFVKRYQQKQPPRLTDCLSATPSEIEARIAPLWELSLRASLPRLSDPQRKEMKSSITPKKRARALEYAALFIRREDLAQEAGLRGQIFLDLLSRDVVASQLIQATGRVAQAARDGRYLLNATMAALSTRVLLSIEHQLQDDKLPRARREKLLAYLGAIDREAAEAAARTEDRKRRAERRLSSLRQRLGEAEKNAEVRRLLQQLMPDHRPAEGGAR